MAKIAFSKLGIKKNTEVITIHFNGQEIEVKQYLPINDKLALISNVINSSQQEDSDYMNPVKVYLFTKLEIVYNYTNITFTDKQKEDIAKLYDLLYSSKLIEMVENAIPKDEIELIYNAVQESVDSIYQYKQSVLGIMDALGTDYKDLELDATKIQDILANKEGMEFLDEVLAKMG